jgi:DNA-binding NtrC family response regulator
VELSGLARSGVYRCVKPNLTVLFVEDDRPVRTVTADALSQRGFHVLSTDNAGEALRLLAEEPVDVLFADIVMPGINGIELAKKAKALHPDLKVLLATGYFSRAHEALAVGKLLFKPLRAEQIEAEILELVKDAHSAT